MLFKKVTRRWLINGLGVVIILLVILEAAMAAVIRSHYYKQAENSLYTRAKSLSDMLYTYAEQPDFDFEKNVRLYIEGFPDKEIMELQLLDRSGNILASSTGFLPELDKKQDYQAAVRNYLEKRGKTVTGIWQGKNAVGQTVMAMTMLIVSDDGTSYGAIRFIADLDLINRHMTFLSSALIFIGLAVIFFVLISNSYFISSILHPLAEISETAKKIAHGEHACRIEKKSDDEIGELCDTINDMATKISTVEKMQNEFISSISHELRTPLTAIKGWSETLRDSDMKDETLMKKGLDVISQEAERLSGMVEELLDFSNIQKNKPVMAFEKIDVYAELEGAVFLYRDKAEKAGICLECVQQEPLPEIWGNRDRLKQVFINILDNALKYSKAGGVIHAEAARLGTDVQVVISDTGIGISSEDLPHIKTRFYRAGNQTPGSGIGLAVADEIIAAHNGKLVIESEIGKGTVVTVTLPAEN